MLSLAIKPQAESDLAQIYQYTAAKWGITQADKYQDELYAAMKLLAENINLGKEYSHSNQAYRRLHTNRHLIFYRTTESEYVIVRILHDTMDVDKHLG